MTVRRSGAPVSGKGCSKMRRRRRFRRSDGFTLVEVLVALTILGVGILGVTVLFPMSLNQTRRAAGISSANNVAVGLAKRYQAQGYDGIQQRILVVNQKPGGRPVEIPLLPQLERIRDAYTLYEAPRLQFSTSMRHFARSLRLYRVSITMDLPTGGRESYVTFVAKE